MALTPRKAEVAWIERLAHLDRRLAYVLLAVVVVIPLVSKFRLPMLVGPQAKALHDAIEKVPPDKPILLVPNYSPVTEGENGPQMEALVRHLLRTGKKFLIYAQDQLGPQLAENIVEKENSRLAAVTGGMAREYGKDWVNFGYKYGGGAILISMAKDIPGFMKKDIKGNLATELQKLPIMTSIHTIKDVSMIILVTGSGYRGEWVQFVSQPYKVPFGHAVTGVMGPEEYPYMQSGQLVGLLVGMKGAAEFEKLSQASGRGTTAMTAQSFAHVLIMVLIIVGNIGFLSRRRREQRVREAGP